ncbi:aspartyl/asparaginyl beta-hydroxylase domain-containing protein [Mucilaginibacter lacusdianchii]|uniref:aspartyl/asparaginyl beta-hydroxylase domain-containing protein n=1 Tax=Mucilaginibacter lacusdianchii TaxID=2684211 RepID=UPI00131B55E0|nr:aspartyl/asparaginyl beta-hydroxylase domain-containing protein [Mucilaginibacter sp. JXJ CY 39]
MIVFAKLPITVNILDLQTEIGAILQDPNWVPHFNAAAYRGDWTIFPLRTPGGHSDKPYADLLGENLFEDTQLINALPFTKALLDGLQCQTYSVRLLKLGAGASIKAHRDPGLAFEQGEARLHFPVFTHDEVQFFVEEDLVPMRAGECWYINANLTHQAVNMSTKDRIHLVIDCQVNNWLEALFNKGETREKIDESDLITQRAIIAELRQQNTPQTLQLANELEMKTIKNQILNFLTEVGLPYRLEQIEEESFLPGLKLANGTLLIDDNKLLYPGDILHEAGHLACAPPNERMKMNGALENNDQNNAGELMAIAWSYAACVHIGIDPHVVFHENGYKSGGSSIVNNFSQGHYFGVPMLQYYGLAFDETQAKIHGVEPFPHMLQWICTAEDTIKEDSKEL